MDPGEARSRRGCPPDVGRTSGAGGPLVADRDAACRSDEHLALAAQERP